MTRLLGDDEKACYGFGDDDVRFATDEQHAA
jgi:hypothetical protein